jgi:uncharacterized RDD family membrane protein YckC
MICTYCDSANSETDHRCRRCGRRLLGTAVSAPPGYQTKAIGATALAVPAADAKAGTESETRPVQGSSTPKAADRLPRSAQSLLFSEESPSRVIPFDAQQRESLLRSARTAKRNLDSVLRETSELAPPPRRTPVKTAGRKNVTGDPRGEQSTLDFVPNPPQAARTLKTTVEAVIYCDATVAPPINRAIAAMLDGSIIFLSLGCFLGIFEVFGGPFPWTRQNIAICGGVVALIAMFYSFIWALCGRETAGMKWTGLRVINFNGFPPDGKSRALRLIGCWLSYCSGMIGIFWALVDEESLTWHDHMSKTFPTARETSSSFVRERV